MRQLLTQRVRKLALWGFALAMVASLLVPSAAIGQEPPKAEEAQGEVGTQGGGAGQGKVSPQAIIIQPPPAGGLSASLWTSKSSYVPGESIQISFTVSRDAYVYIIDLDTEGRVRLLFPNRYEPDNYVRAGTRSIPGGGYRLVVSGPPGTEYLQLVAVTRPIDILGSGTVQGQGGGVSAFAVEPFPTVSQPEGLKARLEAQLRSLTNLEWAVAWTSFRLNASSFPAPRVNRPPSAGFTFSPLNPRARTVVRFDASNSSDPDGRIEEYRWDFNDDGWPDAWGRRAEWAFSQPGSYLVRLTVVDDQGASDAVTQRLQVLPLLRQVRLRIDSSPSGAEVYVDGRYEGRTPLTVWVEEGDRNLRVVRSGYRTWSSPLSLWGLEELGLDLTLQR